jgi:hypothetical protein
MTTAQAPPEPDGLARLWGGYARKVYGSYSPLNSALADAVSRSPRLLDFVQRQPSHAHDPNMLLAAVQFIVLTGTDHPLASLYAEGNGTDPAAVTELLESFCEEHRDELVRILADRRIQTNEVGRAPGLALGLACAARLIGEPLALVDAGASAGLNLILDEYRLRFGSDAEVGPASSSVVIDCRIQPADLPLPRELPPIYNRAGIDRSPVDLSDPANVRWLLACIWPGTGRQQRAAAAMELMAARPPLVREGDMVTDLPSLLDDVRRGPVAVVTSWSFSYLLADARREFESVLRTAGRVAPVAWVCCDTAGVTDLFRPTEPPPDDNDIPSVLGLAVFDGERVESRCLGYMHSHGAWVNWLDHDLTPASHPV